MAERTAQLIGFTPGCQIKIHWNGVQVFDGIVSASGTTDDLAALAQWSTSTDITGQVPLVIECLSGELHFSDIFMNMVSPLTELQITSQPSWTIYTPTDEELLMDLVSLTPEQINAKYAMTRAEISEHVTRVELQSIDTNFRLPVKSLDWSESDGKTSIEINGEAFERHDVDIYTGAWQWLIQQGQTLSCLIQVDDFTS